ncbi:DUF6807 family protein [Actinoplanes sp. DH11]|uniref:DUF6807 family protein n=1 Tax=Actinoplanes sp. DH11 TaxID=2857011 RepID=UPI001E29FCA8|nr:DUF6807 family protein [Actinoplanes sp. DH11]
MTVRSGDVTLLTYSYWPGSALHSVHACTGQPVPAPTWTPPTSDEHPLLHPHADESLTELTTTGGAARIAHRLIWTGHDGTPVLDEWRALTTALAGDDSWVLLFENTLTNISGGSLTSSTGSGGLRWRGALFCTGAGDSPAAPPPTPHSQASPLPPPHSQASPLPLPYSQASPLPLPYSLVPHSSAPRSKPLRPLAPRSLAPGPLPSRPLPSRPSPSHPSPSRPSPSRPLPSRTGPPRVVLVGDDANPAHSPLTLLDGRVIAFRHSAVISVGAEEYGALIALGQSTLNDA